MQIFIMKRGEKLKMITKTQYMISTRNIVWLESEKLSFALRQFSFPSLPPHKAEC